MARIEDVTLLRVRSHGVQLDYDGGHGLQATKEECYPVVSMTVAGTVREVDVVANRYRHSEGMSDWRILLRDVSPDAGIGEVTRGQVREAAQRIVGSWLENNLGTADDGPNGSYARSRPRAYAQAVTYAIRAANTTADYRGREALDRFGHELTVEDCRRLTRAYGLRMKSLHFLEG